MTDGGWVVVVPVKPLASAKSRLTDFAGESRPALALAMVLDTVRAAATTPGVIEVIVVSADPDVAARVSGLATPIAEEPQGLDMAFRRGISAAQEHHPQSGVALLVSDLPALRPAELDTALAHASSVSLAVSSGSVAVSSTSLVVADAAGTGSTLLASAIPAALQPAFGDGSFARHRALGATPLGPREGLILPGLRRDVDTLTDLREALAIGVGTATTAAVRDLGCAHISH